MAPISAYSVPKFSPSTLVINMDSLRSNLKYFQNLLSKKTRIMVMVKANAYGCGAVEVSRALQTMGIRDLGVAYTHEGVHLREHGVKTAIMVMNPLPGDIPELVRHGLEPELASLDLLAAWVSYVREYDLKDYPVHLEVDTGMHRLGFDAYEALEVGALIRSVPSIRIRSVFTHLAASADPDQDEFTRIQFSRLEEWDQTLREVSGQSPLKHALNSAGICRFPDHQYDMVRLGIGMYGVGLESLPDQSSLQPVQSIYATISQIRRVEALETVSYDRKGWLEKPGRIAVINLGYADGFPRLAGHGRYSVQIGNILCPVVGTVCMDMIMVDVSDCPAAEVGDVVEIYGPGQPMGLLAEAARTIPYEILTGNHDRLRRITIG